MHTKGPWKLETVKTSIGVCHKIGPLGITTKIKSACLYDNCYSDKAGDLQLLGDAYLIAAAPDLLEACKAALPILKYRHDHGDDSNDEESAYQIVRNAIAKAEGR